MFHKKTISFNWWGKKKKQEQKQKQKQKTKHGKTDHRLEVMYWWKIYRNSYQHVELFKSVYGFQESKQFTK